MDPETRKISDAMYRALARAIMLGGALFILAAFVDAISVVVLFGLMAVIFAIGLSPAVNWLEARKFPRGAATVAVLVGIAATGAGVLALVLPRVTAEMQNLEQNVQIYSSRLADRVNEIAGQYPEVDKVLRDPQLREKLLPSVSTIAGRVGRLSLSAITLVLGLLILVTVIAYVLIRPRPLLRSLLTVFPVKLRDRAALAYSRGAQGVVNWVWANAIIGAIEGVLTAIFLSLIGLPGAVTWGMVTFFAELIPQLGSYLMAVPPLIVAIAVDPAMAPWVLVWFIALQQAVNHIIAPLIRSSAMNIHPISEIFAVLALSIAFGLLGAIIASPVVVFVKAFYDAFYPAASAEDPEMDRRVEAMLVRSEIDTHTDAGAEGLPST